MNISGATVFLLDTIFSIFIIVVLLRVVLQFVRAPFSNPISQFIVNVTNFGFKPLRKVIPGFKGVDFAGIVFAYLLCLLNLITVTYISYQTTPAILTLLLQSVFLLISSILTILFWSIIIRIIFSLVFNFVAGSAGGYNPIYSVVYMITEPILAPIRRLIPPVSGFDLSPLVACLLISVVRILFNIR